MKATGVIKLLILALNVILIFSLPLPSEPDGLLTSPGVTFVFMSIAVPCFYLLVKKAKTQDLQWPDWNVSLFNPKGKSPFGNVDFVGTIFVTIGLAMIGSRKIDHDDVSRLGLTSVSLGLGILFGLLLTITIGKRLNRTKG